jgi:lipid II:glycine glycyltransferase (peptidoglycan interpeptide bridge formation enzyme)
VPVAYTTSPPEAELTNGLVLCRVQSRLTGRRLVSLPFSDHCEPLVDSPDDLELLLRSLELDGTTKAWKYIEIRSRTALAVPPPWSEPVDASYLHTVDLTPGLEEIFRGLHKNCTQRKIRRAEREKLSYEEGHSGALLEEFYGLLLRTRRRHRLPPHPHDWFRNLADCLGDQAKIRIASKDGQPIAGILTLASKDVLIYKYGCSDQRFHKLGGMHLLLWKTIQEGKQLHAREFDLGRSDADNHGLITFKDHWSAKKSRLTYWRYPARPHPTMSASWRTEMAKKIFSRLPDSLLVGAGRMLYRHIG